MLNNYLSILVKYDRYLHFFLFFPSNPVQEKFSKLHLKFWKNGSTQMLISGESFSHIIIYCLEELHSVLQTASTSTLFRKKVKTIQE